MPVSRFWVKRCVRGEASSKAPVDSTCDIYVYSKCWKSGTPYFLHRYPHGVSAKDNRLPPLGAPPPVLTSCLVVINQRVPYVTQQPPCHTVFPYEQMHPENPNIVQEYVPAFQNRRYVPMVYDGRSRRMGTYNSRAGPSASKSYTPLNTLLCLLINKHTKRNPSTSGNGSKFNG